MKKLLLILAVLSCGPIPDSRKVRFCRSHTDCALPHGEYCVSGRCEWTGPQPFHQR